MRPRWPAHQHQSKTEGLAASEAQRNLREKLAGFANRQHPIELNDAQPAGVVGPAADRQRFVAIDRDATIIEIKACRCSLAAQPRDTFLPNYLRPPLHTCIPRNLFEGGHDDIVAPGSLGVASRTGTVALAMKAEKSLSWAIGWARTLSDSSDDAGPGRAP